LTGCFRAAAVRLIDLFGSLNGWFRAAAVRLIDLFGSLNGWFRAAAVRLIDLFGSLNGFFEPPRPADRPLRSVERLFSSRRRPWSFHIMLWNSYDGSRSTPTDNASECSTKATLIE
jgi:hypothetical protein